MKNYLRNPDANILLSVLIIFLIAINMVILIALLVSCLTNGPVNSIASLGLCTSVILLALFPFYILTSPYEN